MKNCQAAGEAVELVKENFSSSDVMKFMPLNLYCNIIQTYIVVDIRLILFPHFNLGTNVQLFADIRDPASVF